MVFNIYKWKYPYLSVCICIHTQMHIHTDVYTHTHTYIYVCMYADTQFHGDCSHEIKRRLLLGRKAMTNLDSIIKSRDITFANKGSYSQCMVFPVYESWTIKKAERWRIDAFELWCWGRLLTVPWTARRSNQSILKEINAEYSLEGLMLNLWFFGHVMPRADSLEKTLMLGKIEGKRRRGWQSM